MYFMPILVNIFPFWTVVCAVENLATLPCMYSPGAAGGVEPSSNPVRVYVRDLGKNSNSVKLT
jgi:hypothetical protein